MTRLISVFMALAILACTLHADDRALGPRDNIRVGVDKEAAAVWLTRALTAAPEIKDDAARDAAYASLSMQQAAAGMVPAAMETFGKIHDTSKAGYSAVSIVVYALQANRIDDAKKIADSITDPVLKAQCLNSFAYYQKTPESIQNAIDFIKTMPDKTQRTRAIADLAFNLAWAGAAQDALKVAALIENDTDRDTYLGNMASRAASAGNKDALAIAQQIKNPQARATILCGFLSYEWAKKDEARDEILREAWAAALQIQDADQKKIMQSSIISSQPSEERMGPMMKEAGIEGEEADGLLYNYHLYHGKIDAALADAQKFSNARKRFIALSSLIDYMAHTGVFDGAKAVLAAAVEAAKESKQGDMQYFIASIVQLARQQAAAGDKKSASETYAAAVDLAKMDPNADMRLRAIVLSESWAGLFDDAAQTALQTPHRWATVEMFKDIINLQVNAKDFDGAKRMAAEILKQVQAGDEPRENGVLGSVVRVLADGGMPDEAQAAFREMTMGQERLWCMPYIAAAQAKKGDREAAAKTFADATDAMVKAGDVYGLVSTIPLLKAAGFNDEAAKACVLAKKAVTELYGSKDHYPEMDDNTRAESLCRVLGEIGLSQASLAKEDARQTFREANNVLEKDTNWDTKLPTLIANAQWQKACGFTEDAEKTFGIIIAYASDIADDKGQQMLQRVTEQAANTGLYATALKAALTFSDANQRNYMFTVIVRRLILNEYRNKPAEELDKLYAIIKDQPPEVLELFCSGVADNLLTGVNPIRER